LIEGKGKEFTVGPCDNVKITTAERGAYGVHMLICTGYISGYKGGWQSRNARVLAAVVEEAMA
jgi:hypothetical protein